MPDFVIWGRVEHSGPQEFVALATATPMDLNTGRPIVRLRVCASRDLAEEARDQLVRELGEEVIGRGDCVADVEVE